MRSTRASRPATTCNCPHWSRLATRSPSFFDQPHFRDLASAAVTAKRGLAIPAQIQLAGLCSLPGNLEFNGRNRIRFCDQRMNLDLVTLVIGDQTDFDVGTVAGVGDADLVLGVAVEMIVMHLQRSIAERLGSIPPGTASLRAIGVADV